MNKKQMIILTLAIIGIVIISLYTTYAIDVGMTKGTSEEYDMLLTFDISDNTYKNVVAKAGKTKIYDIEISNTYDGKLQYGLVYQMVNPITLPENIIIAKVSESQNETVGLIEKDEKLSISIVIANQSTTDITISLSIIPGYEKGGDLILNTNQTLITEEYELVPSFYEDNSGANSPDLVNGLIPVVYDGTKWVKADAYNSDSSYSWYDYGNKKWANAVLVSSTNRSIYANATSGTEISSSDILAFYVWIPRYKYKVWNISKQAGSESTYAYNAKTNGIDIVFEDEKSSTGTITCSYNFNVNSSNGGINLSTTTAETCNGSNGDYYTHPAFCLGKTTDGVCSGETLRGFWIGKFELSSSNPSASYGGGNSTSLTPRVLPNVVSWKYNYVSNFSTVIQNMTKSSNIYGLSSSTTSSHMLTNMEWGAVAYLTNSEYGRCTNDTCTEVELNASGETTNYTTKTGCGPISSGSDSYGTTCNAYDTTLGVSASTTGNITGVYDMRGGAYEYVMGNISSVTTGYTFYPSSSNFSSSWYTTNNNSKILTTYAYDTVYSNQTAYNRGRLGDATAEIVLSAGDFGGWYGDYTHFLYSNYAWFVRGGMFLYGSYAGPFNFYYGYGSSNNDHSTRLALAKIN